MIAKRVTGNPYRGEYGMLEFGVIKPDRFLSTQEPENREGRDPAYRLGMHSFATAAGETAKRRNRPLATQRAKPSQGAKKGN